MQTAPAPRSTRYSHGHDKKGNGVGHLDAVTDVEGPSPVIMKKPGYCHYPRGRVMEEDKRNLRRMRHLAGDMGANYTDSLR
jgi:hypothetical protein